MMLVAITDDINFQDQVPSTGQSNKKSMATLKTL